MFHYSVSSMPGHILKINWGRPALRRALSVCRGRAGSAGEFLSLVLHSCRPRVLSKLKNDMAKGQVPLLAVFTRMTLLLCPARLLSLWMRCFTLARLLLRCIRLKEVSFIRIFLYPSRLSCAQLPMGTVLLEVTCPTALLAEGVRPDIPKSITGQLSWIHSKAHRQSRLPQLTLQK